MKRWWWFLIAVGAVVAGAFLAQGAPHLVVLNKSLRVQYPWWRTGGAVLMGAGFALAGWAARSRWAWLPAGLVALLFFLTAAKMGRYRLDVDDEAVRQREWHEAVLPWSQIAQVEPKADAVLLRTDTSVVTIDTHDLRPEDRAALDRNLARHLSQLPALR
jgi:hypothetical protein